LSHDQKLALVDARITEYIVNNLPNTYNKPEAKRLGTKHVSDDQHLFLTKLHVVQRWIMTKCLTMNPTAAVIPRPAALMTATLTVTKAVQITSKTSYVPSLPLVALPWLSVPIFWLCGVDTKKIEPGMFAHVGAYRQNVTK
jgi:hypothetical protein